VPVEGDVAGGALPMSAGTSFHGAQKAERIGVPADHGRHPGRGEARNEGDVAIEVCVEKPQPSGRAPVKTTSLRLCKSFGAHQTSASR
jgi:hypothetical protein